MKTALVLLGGVRHMSDVCEPRVFQAMLAARSVRQIFASAVQSGGRSVRDARFIAARSCVTVADLRLTGVRFITACHHIAHHQELRLWALDMSDGCDEVKVQRVACRAMRIQLEYWDLVRWGSAHG